MSDANRISEADLRAALDQGRFQASYQPIVSLGDHRPVGLEVLARLNHPDFGILSPDVFVPRLEDAGLAWPLTRAIIDRAFDDWNRQAMARFGLYLALNFPLDVMLMPSAIDHLNGRRERAGLTPGNIVIELTESRPIQRVDELDRAVARLHAEGYGLAIDDVGPGLRDPRELMDLRFTALKLDKGVVRGTAAASTEFLVRTIEAAHAAGLTVIAEGVEQPAHWERMHALGVDQAQGFLIARPFRPSAVEPWLNGWRTRHPP